MSLVKPLIFRPKPFKDEGMQGFILRLAEGNQLISFKQLWGDSSPSPHILSQLLGIRESSWTNRLFRQRDNKGNHPIWNSRTRRYCPYCLRDTPYWRQSWELSLMTTCAAHSVSLIESCTACGQVHVWKRGKLLRCVCGHDLRMSEPLPADEMEYKLAQALNHKLWGYDSEITNLELLDLEQLHSLIITLGVYGKPGARTSLRRQKTDSLSTTQQLMRTASEVLLNWPQGFYRMLDQIQRSMESSSESASLSGRFGRFYAYLYGHYKEPKYGFLLHAFEDYLEQNWRHSFAERNKRLSRPLRNKHVWVPIKTIAKELAAGIKRIIFLVESGEIESSRIKTTGGRTVLCINRQQVDVIRSLLKDRIDLKMASEILGVKEQRVLQLIDYRLLGKVISPRESGSGRWYISRTSLDQILTIGSDLPAHTTTQDSISLGHAIRHLLTKPYLFPALITAILQKDLKPIAIDNDKNGMCSWMFEREVLQQWISDRINIERKGAMPIPLAAKHLKIKQEVVYHFESPLIY